MITVPRWKLLGEQLWQGVQAPLGELTCHRRSKRAERWRIIAHRSPFACGYTAHVPSAASGTVLGKGIGADGMQPLNQLKRCHATTPEYAPRVHRAHTASDTPPMGPLSPKQKYIFSPEPEQVRVPGGTNLNTY